MLFVLLSLVSAAQANCDVTMDFFEDSVYEHDAVWPLLVQLHKTGTDACSLHLMADEFLSFGASATAGDDFDALDRTVSFGPGDQWAEIELTVNDDFEDEGDEQFLVWTERWSGVTSVDRSSMVATIIDDDGGFGVVRANFLVDAAGDFDGLGDYELQEEWRQGAWFHVFLDHPLDTEASVHYEATSWYWATAGVDFTPVSGVLTFAPGTADMYVEVPFIDDGLVEDAEDVELVLYDATGAPLSIGSTAMVWIDDDDGLTTPGDPVVVLP